MSTRKVFLITGCSSGFGYNLAQHFLAAGHNVVATARDVSKVDVFVKKYPQNALALRLDVTDKASIQDAVEKTIQRFGCIDVLINNAGFGNMTVAEMATEHELRSIMETNYFGAVFVTAAVLPQMRKQRSGTIIQVSSVLGVVTMPSSSAYSASKFALVGFSEALAQEVAPLGIHVVIVEPGSFKTGISGKMTAPTEEAMKDYDSVKQTVQVMNFVKGNEFGDPAKFAVAIEKILALEKPPVRIPIGTDSISIVRARVAKHLEEIDAYKHVGSGTDFDTLDEGQLAVLKMFSQQQ